ncbi:branched-chain amino acid ABC transporter permease [Bradyrhizobium brasilense]|uniref:branched-chain amino acid ABC transporter permease n=1 Tax=Bradyrhizobium brasilense TaxID=1419277 RepID=UPI001456B951|nr:branched-chain amino acid ABC transporter permease [Bradyrhizobium brasilense]
MWLSLGLAALALFILPPRLLSDFQLYTFNLALVNVLLAIGLNLVIGVARQFALFSGALFGVGAYVAAICQMRFGLGFLAAIPFAMMAGLVVAAVTSLVAWRAGDLYLAMITFGFGEIFQFFLVHADSLTNGPDGLAVPRPVVFGVSFATPAQLFLLFLPLTIAALVSYRLIERGRLGQLLVALGDSEVALAAIGHDHRLVKTLAFAVQGAYAGLAGAMFAAAVGFIDPYSFGLSVTLQQLTAIAVGGFGSLFGAVTGSIVLTLIDRVLIDFPGLRELGYGVCLLAVFLVFPGGLAGVLLPRRGAS